MGNCSSCHKKYRKPNPDAPHRDTGQIGRFYPRSSLGPPNAPFHWTLLVLVVSAWATYEFAEVARRRNVGAAPRQRPRAADPPCLASAVGRLRLFDGTLLEFRQRPAPDVDVCVGLVSGANLAYLGHNPLGAVDGGRAARRSLFAIGTLGLFATDDSDLVGGPLYRLVDEAANARAARLHDRIFHVVLLPLAALHIVANVVYTFVKKSR